MERYRTIVSVSSALEMKAKSRLMKRRRVVVERKWIESQDFMDGFLSTVISGRLIIPSAKMGLVSFTRRRIRKVTVRCRFGGTVNLDIQVRRVPSAGTVAFIEFLYPPSKSHLTAISLELRQ